MNKQHIKQILAQPHINLSQSCYSKTLRYFSYFNPYTSEYVHFDMRIVPKNNHYELYVYNVLELKNSVDLAPHHQNYIKHFRSFILATLIGGMQCYNGAKLVLCKNELAAKRYKNLGGQIVCIKNSRNNKIWAVVK